MNQFYFNGDVLAFPFVPMDVDEPPLQTGLQAGLWTVGISQAGVLGTKKQELGKLLFRWVKLALRKTRYFS